MSTTTQRQIRTQTVNIAPAPCRMIRVVVFENVSSDPAVKLWGISWSDVIGIMCAPNIEYPNRIDVWPVVVGDSPWEGELCVVDSFHDSANVAFRAIAVCLWPPEQDQENAIRIGKELIAKDGEVGNWVSIPVELKPSQS